MPAVRGPIYPVVAILRAAGRPMPAKDIVAQLRERGMNPTNISAGLKMRELAGEVVRVAHGVWATPESAKQWVAAPVAAPSAPAPSVGSLTAAVVRVLREVGHPVTIGELIGLLHDRGVKTVCTRTTDSMRPVLEHRCRAYGDVVRVGALWAHVSHAEVPAPPQSTTPVGREKRPPCPANPLGGHLLIATAPGVYVPFRCSACGFVWTPPEPDWKRRQARRVAA